MDSSKYVGGLKTNLCDQKETHWATYFQKAWPEENSMWNGINPGLVRPGLDRKIKKAAWMISEVALVTIMLPAFVRRCVEVLDMSSEYAVDPIGSGISREKKRLTNVMTLFVGPRRILEPQSLKIVEDCALQIPHSPAFCYFVRCNGRIVDTVSVPAAIAGRKVRLMRDDHRFRL